MLCSGSYDHTIRTWDLCEMKQRIGEKGLMMQEDIGAWKLETYNRLMKTKKKKKKAKGKNKKGKK